MKATGEVMAIDRCFEAALQKAVRSLEISGQSLLWEDPGWMEQFDSLTPTSSNNPSLNNPSLSAHSGEGSTAFTGGQGESDVAKSLFEPSDTRIWAMMYALRRGVTPDDLAGRTLIDPWFLHSLGRIVDMESRLLREQVTPELLGWAKRLGFSDEQLGTLADMLPEQVRSLRHSWDIRPVYKMVDTCAAEFEAATPYYYSTYEQENEAPPLDGPKAIVVGSGPIRIGQGIEFDYCSVHAAWALKEEGTKSIMVNSNPETVSTDFDTSHRLYFEPLDEESLRDIIENETGEGGPPPSVVQFGGQTAINLSQSLARAGLPLLGSGAESIDMASDRQKFEEFLGRLGVFQPPGAAVTSVEEALRVAQDIDYPVVVRPSYVLGGRAMEIVQNATELIRYLTAATEVGQGKPVLIDKYLEGKECEVDAICDGREVLIPGVMEHIERAGVHSGDSMATYPALNLTEAEVDTVVDYTTRIGLALDIRGLMNVQFVILGGAPYRSPRLPRENAHDTAVYILEVNPRASRTIPFISKVTGVPVVNLATRVMMGRSLAELGYSGGLWKRQKVVGIKAPVFSMSKLIGVDWYMGPEMKSTGEVMGIDHDLSSALAKALTAADLTLKPGGAVLLSIADKDKAESVTLIKELIQAGFKLYATEGTAAMIEAMGAPVTMITKKLSEGSFYPGNRPGVPDSDTFKVTGEDMRPSAEGPKNVVDVINEGLVNCVVNTVTQVTSILRDGFYIRRAAVEKHIPCFTSLDTARAAVESLLTGSGTYSVKPTDQYLNVRWTPSVGQDWGNIK